MSNFSDQLEEMEASISSRATKSLAYSTLLYLQEQSGNSPASIRTLAQSTPSLISLIVADVHDRDEEIAVQALKCLGFMMYHPSIVTAISERSNLVLESLVKLITTTKMKSVCNLGVWCISVQQFSESVLVSHFNSLLPAVVHGLDNPFGSLSTTFEAIQAVMRLAVQLIEKMRDSSHVWAPPIYRRLISLDKRERDISERCLLKIRSLIVPPPLKLSKVLVKDMRQTLLTGMKDLLSNGLKVQTIRAWGWFIHLLGSYALKNRNLINDMLKIPEQTFSDHDPQLQIASQVAWEGLIDALIHPTMLPYNGISAEEVVCFEQVESSERENAEQGNGFSKSIKLIMTPLIGIMSSECDVSVHASCFNTWRYLLHKLDSSVNSSIVKRLVLQPIFEAVLQIGPDSKSIFAWNMCIDLLNDSILAKCRDMDKESSNMGNHHLLSTTSINGTSASGKCPWKQYPVKWLPWELSNLDFHLKFIYILINQATKASLSCEERSLAYDASLRLFRSVLKGVQMKLKKLSTTYDDIMLCLNTMLKFIKNLHEEHFEGSDREDLNDICLKLIEAVSEEIETAMLGSPLYKMALDLKHIERLSVVDETRHAKTLEMCFINYMDMVSPIVYLSVLYFRVMVQSNLDTHNSVFFQKAIQKYFKIMLSSYEPLENFIVTVGLLYKHRGPSCLRTWIEIAKGLKDCMSDMKNVSFFESDCAYFAMCDLLCYPFIISYCHQKDLMSAKICEDSHVFLQRNLEFEQVVEQWKSLYGSLLTLQFGCFTTDHFSDDLSGILDEWLDNCSKIFESANVLESSHEGLDLNHISVYGSVVICILEKSQSSVLSQDESNNNTSRYKIPAGINNCLTLAIRFMRLLQTKRVNNLPTNLDVASRFYTALAHFISCLHLRKQDIHSFLEMISSPLFEWLTQVDMQGNSANHQFQLVWTGTLDCLRRSNPPLVFDSSFLQLQSSLLEKTLDHSNPNISEPTITFWNSTYGDQIKLDYPQNLLHILDKLSRNGKINLYKRIPPLLERCESALQANAALKDYRGNATHNVSSKRLGLVKGNMNLLKHKDMPSLNMKRKRLELTEHQKEVRSAQRGRERDCGGHGLGGIRTYSNLDFSQGNEDSQESQEMWNLESMLDKSKEAS